MTTVPIQLNDMDLLKIDYLIKIGRYKNRNQALKKIIEEKLSQEIIKFDFENDDDEILCEKVVDKFTKSSQFHFRISSNKSAAELVSEERERY